MYIDILAWRTTVTNLKTILKFVRNLLQGTHVLVVVPSIFSVICSLRDYV